MEFLPVTSVSLEKGAKILKKGGLVAFPTETVYGLGADAFNPHALAKIFEVKGRPHFDPLIIHIASINMLGNVADLSLLNEGAREKLFLLAEHFWPGPLSIVLPKNKRIPEIATAGLQTAAIRFPDSNAAQKLIFLSTGAVAAPSANPFGTLSPTKAEHVRGALGEKIDMILDGGPARIGLESTVIDIIDDEVKILRPGGTPKEEIEALLKTNIVFTEQNSIPNHQSLSHNHHSMISGSRQQIPKSPGQLKSHYAPQTPLCVLSREEIIKKQADTETAKTAFLFFDNETKDAWQKKQAAPLQNKEKNDAAVIRVLSETGDLLGAASCFFETLHELDACGASQIYAQEVPRHGLGEAINDRLTRASAR